MATGVFSKSRAEIKERTLRTDRWWLQPAITVAVLVSFIIYATFRAFEKNYYFAEWPSMVFLCRFNLQHNSYL